MAVSTEEPLPRKVDDGEKLLEAGSDLDPATAPSDDEPPPLSLFSQAQKRRIILLAAFAVMLSPMSSFILYPAIMSIANDLSDTVDLANLTFTTYTIMSGSVLTLQGNGVDKPPSSMLPHPGQRGEKSFGRF
jgi:hypothetical protein